MPKRPPVPERDFLKLCRNHGELTSMLTKIGIDGGDVTEYAKYVSACWFRPGEEHLTEASRAIRTRSTRTVLSRAYYAAYNASKALRYIVYGTVSLKGDDHKNASTELPDDMKDVADWSRKVAILYEHRVPIRLTRTPTIYSMRQPWRRNAVRRRIDKGSGQFLTVLKSGGGLKSLRKLNS